MFTREKIYSIFFSVMNPPKHRFIEPIFQVDFCFLNKIFRIQASIAKPGFKPMHCLSSKCDRYLNEFFENNLPQSFNQIFLEQQDTLEMGRPNMVVTSPNIIIRDEQMSHMQDEALKRLQKQRNEIRKRFALMQMNDCVFILGGYVVERKKSTEI
jgi:hypothetical protein